MKIEILCIALVAIFWGGYPLLVRSGGYGGPLASLTLVLASMVPITAAVVWQESSARPELLTIGKLIVAGLMMGVGLLAFNFVASSSKLDASISIPIMDTTMMIVTVIGAIWFFAEPFSVQKGVGLTFLVTGILILRPT